MAIVLSSGDRSLTIHSTRRNRGFMPHFMGRVSYVLVRVITKIDPWLCRNMDAIMLPMPVPVKGP